MVWDLGREESSPSPPRRRTDEEEDEEEDEKLRLCPLSKLFMFHIIQNREYGRRPASVLYEFQGTRQAVEALDLEGKLEGHHGCVNSISFDRTGQFLISGSDDRRLLIWCPQKGGAPLASLSTPHHSNIFSAVFSSDVASSWSCSREGRVVLHHVELETHDTIFQHGQTAYQMCADPLHPALCYSCGQSGRLVLHDRRVRISQHLGGSAQCVLCLRHPVEIEIETRKCMHS